VDEIIIFNNLTRSDVEYIVDLQMQEIRERLLEHGLVVSLTDPAKRWLAEQGYDPQFGARPLRRVIQRCVESPLSIGLLRGQFVGGASVLVDLEDDALVFCVQSQESVEVTPEAEPASVEGGASQSI